MATHAHKPTIIIQEPNPRKSTSILTNKREILISISSAHSIVGENPTMDQKPDWRKRNNESKTKNQIEENDNLSSHDSKASKNQCHLGQLWLPQWVCHHRLQKNPHMHCLPPSSTKRVVSSSLTPTSSSTKSLSSGSSEVFSLRVPALKCFGIKMGRFVSPVVIFLDIEKMVPK